MDRQLYWASSNGFSATCDAFVVGEEKFGFRDLRLLSVIGGEGAVRAIAAGVLKRDTEVVRLLPNSDDPGVSAFGAIRQQNSVPWRSRIMRLPQTKAWHSMIYSTMLEFNREEAGFVLLSDPGATEAIERHLQFINRRVALPIHPFWASWLWQRGLYTGEIKPMMAEGISAWECAPDQMAMKTDIGKAIRSGALVVPAKEIIDG